MEVIERRPQEFKIQCLKDIRSLFPSSINPYYAGYGNRFTDFASYAAAGVPQHRIFIVNHRGELRQETMTSYVSSYQRHTELVDQMYPPMLADNEVVLWRVGQRLRQRPSGRIVTDALSKSSLNDDETRRGGRRVDGGATDASIEPDRPLASGGGAKYSSAVECSESESESVASLSMDDSQTNVDRFNSFKYWSTTIVEQMEEQIENDELFQRLTASPAAPTTPSEPDVTDSSLYGAPAESAATASAVVESDLGSPDHLSSGAGPFFNTPGTVTTSTVNLTSSELTTVSSSSRDEHPISTTGAGEIPPTVFATSALRGS